MTINYLNSGLKIRMVSPIPSRMVNTHIMVFVVDEELGGLFIGIAFHSVAFYNTYKIACTQVRWCYAEFAVLTIEPYHINLESAVIYNGVFISLKSEYHLGLSGCFHVQVHAPCHHVVLCARK